MTRPGSYNLLKLVALVKLLIAVFGTTAFTYQPPEPCPDGCSNGWSVWWELPQSKYCGYAGTYVLFHCHNYAEQENYFLDACYYSTYLPITFR